MKKFVVEIISEGVTVNRIFNSKKEAEQYIRLRKTDRSKPADYKIKVVRSKDVEFPRNLGYTSRYYDYDDQYMLEIMDTMNDGSIIYIMDKQDLSMKMAAIAVKVQDGEVVRDENLLIMAGKDISDAISLYEASLL